MDWQSFFYGFAAGALFAAAWTALCWFWGRK